MTRPVKSVSKRHFEELSMDGIIEKAIRETVVYSFDANGREIDA